MSTASTSSTQWVTSGEIKLRSNAYRQAPNGRDWLVSTDDLYTGSYRVPWSQRLGQAGVPQSGGVLRLERSPKYHPLKARGRGSDPGAFHELAKMPQISRPFKDTADAITGASLRAEAPALKPWHDKERALHARDRQLELAQRILDEWAQPPALPHQKSKLEQLVREMLDARKYGFAWFEILADWRDVHLGLYSHDERPGGRERKERVGSYARRVLWPRLPQWRAPWAVEHWLTQNEELVGVEANFSQASDYRGRHGRHRVIIPVEKLLLVTYRRTGSNWEGYSDLRDVGEFIKMLRSSLITEARAIEINGLGELVITNTEKAPWDAVDAERIDEYMSSRTSKIGNGIRLPHGADAKVLSPQSQIPDLGPQQDRLERMISLAVRGEASLIATQGHGSFAARADASQDARDPLDGVFRELIASPLEELLARALALNFPEDFAAGYCYAPEIKSGQLEERDNKTYLETYQLAVTSGGVTPTPEDEVVIRDLLDLPAREAAGDSDATSSGTQITPDLLQSLRLAYDSGVLFDPDIGPAIRAGLGIPAMTEAGFARFLEMTGKGAQGEAPGPGGSSALPPGGVDLEELGPGPQNQPPTTPAPPPGRWDHIDTSPPSAMMRVASAAVERASKLPRELRPAAGALTRARKIAKGDALSVLDVQRLATALDLATTPLDRDLVGGDAGREWIEEVLAAMDAPPPAPEAPPADDDGEAEGDLVQMREAGGDPCLGDGSKVGIFIRCSPYTDMERGTLDRDPSPAHCTLLYLGDIRGHEEAVLEAVASAAANTPALVASLEMVRSLVNAKGELVLYQVVDFRGGSEDLVDLERLRSSVIAVAKACGIEVADINHANGGRWLPHLARAYCDDLGSVSVPDPIVDEWEVKHIEVWGLPDLHRFDLGGDA